MKKILITVLLFLGILSVGQVYALNAADTIIKVEYFIDTDPGYGMATNIPVTQDTLIEIDFTALLTSAGPGIHFLGIRAMNGEYEWGQTHIYRFLKDNKTTVDLLPDLSRAEYFIDTDLGFGNGTPVTITPDSLLTVSPVANLSSLNPGFHILGIRAKDQDAWGQTHLFRFLLDNKTTNDLLPLITEVEYFIDTDTGFSQCGNVTITTDSMINITQLLGLTGITEGFHVLGIRAKDPAVWGQTHLYRFMNDNLNNIQLLPSVQQVEYFIDTDPGFGNSTTLTISPDSMLNLTQNISMAGLDAGFHMLGIRSKDPRSWGHTHLYRFLNNDEPPALHDLSLIEYFIDVDPGFNFAAKIYPAQDSMWDTTFVADLSMFYVGPHYLGVRAMDTMNKFSHTYIHPFNIVVPPNAYNFTGGGSLCAGGSGLNATLIDSDTGISYILFKDGLPFDTLPGTDTNLVWSGLTGGTYTVTGFNTTSTHIFAPMNGTVTITEYPLPTIVCPADYDVCISTDSLALMGATPAGGTYSGTFVNNNYFYPPSAGTGAKSITYTYTDVHTCTNTCTFNITVNDLPTVSCPSGFDICVSVDSVALTGGLPTGGTYSGTGVNNGYFYPAQIGTGNYTVTYAYTDVNLCNNTCTFVVTVKPLPGVACPAGFAVCNDVDSLLLSGATPAGGTYSGTGVSNGYFHPAQLSPGDYDITYTYQDAYCANLCQFTITVSTPPAVVCPANFELCIDADSVLLTGGLPAGGTFSGMGVNNGYFNPLVATPGIHTITYSYTDVNMCSNTCTFTATVHDVPAVTTGGNLTFCVNADSVLLTGGLPAGGTYSGTGVSNGYFYPQTGTGTYTITYTVTDINTCTGSAAFTIDMINLPNISVNNNSPVCQGETISLTATGGTTYTWTGPGSFTGNTASISIANADLSNAGNYTVEVANAANCTADTTVTVVVNSLPTVIITATETSVCNGLTTTLTASGTNINTYLWSTNASTPQITVTPNVPSTAYSVTVTGSNNCSSTATINIVVNNNPAVTIDATPESCQGKGDGTITVTISTPTVQPYDYLWTFNSNALDSGTTSNTSFVLDNCQAGNYNLMLTDAFNCMVNATYTLAPSTVPCNQGALVPDIFSPNGDNINDILYVYGKNIKDVVLIIYSRWGNKLFESTDINTGWDGKYNGTEMPTGVYAYYLVVTFNDGSAEVKNGDVTLIR